MIERSLSKGSEKVNKIDNSNKSDYFFNMKNKNVKLSTKENLQLLAGILTAFGLAASHYFFINSPSRGKDLLEEQGVTVLEEMQEHEYSYNCGYKTFQREYLVKTSEGEKKQGVCFTLFGPTLP